MADDLFDEEEIDEILPVPGVGRAIELTVQLKTTGMRLDHYLVLQFPDFSRSVLQKAIESDTVTINEQPVKRSTKVKQADRVRVWLPVPDRPEPIPEDIPLDVLYEDEWLAVVNKPFGMVVHPARGNWAGTLTNALAFRFQKLSKLNGDYRPGIVHRLDRDTSGVILVAKEEKAHRDLSMQFESRKIF
jgi:23S rRNA pseudouridine1911/1915/1917 synthase